MTERLTHSLVVQWLRLHAFTTGARGSIPGQGTINKMASRLFEGKNVMKTLKNIIKRCEICQKNNPKTEKLAKSGLQQKYPGEDWEIDFTHMPKANGYSCLQVWVDTFTG